jgi:hypothetical protein
MIGVSVSATLRLRPESCAVVRIAKAARCCPYESEAPVLLQLVPAEDGGDVGYADLACWLWLACE